MNQSFHELLVHSLQDMYNAENQILKALPKMAKAANSSKLKSGFEKHEQQTEKQIERLEKIAKELGFSPKGVPCVGMVGLIKEGQEVMAMKLDPEVIDAGLAIAARKVEHYEMIAYEGMIQHSKMMGHKRVTTLLQETFDEEEITDKELEKLAKSLVNKK